MDISKLKLTSFKGPKKWLGLLLIVVLALGIYFFLRARFGSDGSEEIKEYAALAPFAATDRLTIVSPHLDDETLGAGGLIAQARRKEIPVSVIFMTNGDDLPVGADLEFGTGYPTPDQLIQYGKMRQDEAISALQKLGIEPENIYFLGLPDRGLRELLKERYENIPYRALGTLRTTSPYERSFVPELPYTGTAIRNALVEAINLTSPTYVLTTMPDDRHSDHAATAEFVEEVLDTLSVKPNLYHFLIHYGRYPRPRAVNQDYYLVPPKKLAALPWKVVYLEESDIIQKKEALDEYRSQLRIPFLGKLMRNFVRQNEIIVP